jgi:hypothetical protein
MKFIKQARSVRKHKNDEVVKTILNMNGNKAPNENYIPLAFCMKCSSSLNTHLTFSFSFLLKGRVLLDLIKY